MKNIRQLELFDKIENRIVMLEKQYNAVVRDVPRLEFGNKDHIEMLQRITKLNNEMSFWLSSINYEVYNE